MDAQRVPLLGDNPEQSGNCTYNARTTENVTALAGGAVAAYQEALEERTRKRMPLNWATTQNNLATALTTLGRRESGTAWLEKAVTACREALKEWTQKRVPLNWATTRIIWALHFGP